MFRDSTARTVVLSLLLASATFALYYQVHTHPWSDIDDNVYVVDNYHVHVLNWGTVWWSLTALNYANWIPLSWLSHAVDYHFFGSNPAGHHLVNVGLHALSAILVFWMLKRATGYTARSFMVAALFVVEPLNVEPVVWVAERKTVLSMVFFLLTFAAYHWYARQPSGARYWAVTGLFALALSAKSQVITLPCALLLWDYWPLQRMETPWQEPPTDPPPVSLPRKKLSWLIREKLPLLALSAYDALLTIYTQKSVRVGIMPPLQLRLKNAAFSYWIYLKDFFWPSGMTLESPQMGRFVSAWQALAILALLTAISIAVVAARRYRYLPVGWFWFLGTLVPMVGLLQPGQQGSADRFVYQAYLGLFIMVIWGVADLTGHWHLSKAWLAAPAVAVLLALTLVSNRQIGYWQDNLTVWMHAVQVNKYHWLACDNVGMYLKNQGKPLEALQYYKKATEINPADAGSNFLIGFYDQTIGDRRGAIAYYQRALIDQTQSADFRAGVWRNMGVAYRDLGDNQRALECFRQSASLGAK